MTSKYQITYYTEFIESVEEMERYLESLNKKIPNNYFVEQMLNSVRNVSRRAGKLEKQ